MSFNMLRKIGMQSTGSSDKLGKPDMSRDESETSYCCDLSIVEESSGNDDRSKLIELDDDLKAKILQLEILRETLSTMSAKMRRQEFQLETKDIEIEKWIRLMDEKTTECNEWKTKYEKLVINIESGVTESEKIQQQPNLNIPTFSVAKSCDPLSLSRPWKSPTNKSFATVSDDTSTTSDSIENSYASTEISVRRRPKRCVRSKRNIEICDVAEHLEINDQQIQMAKSQATIQENMSCDDKGCNVSTHDEEEKQQECTIAPEFENEQSTQIEIDADPSNIHDEIESVGFNFEVDVPFSEPENDENPIESACDMEEHDFDQARSAEVEILSLRHFIQLYDHYQIDGEDINCAADLSSATRKDDDAVSVLSHTTLDRSCADLTLDKTHCSAVSVASIASVKQASGLIDGEVQPARTDVQRNKVAKSLRRRILRTALKEAEKAQFNCEVVEC